jgi:hypothetical protein
MARTSKVSLSHTNIPSNQTFAFANNGARNAWYDARTKRDFEEMTFIREEGIQVEAKLEELRQWNFGYYINLTGERIFFRIVDLVYLSDNTVLIRIEKDVLLTYLPSSNMLPSFIERSNEAPTSIFDSDVPEIQYGGGFTHTLLDTFGTPTDLAFFFQVTGGYEPESQKLTVTTYQPKTFNDNTEFVYFPSAFLFLADNVAAAAFLVNYINNGTGDRVVAAGALPDSDVSSTVISDVPEVLSVLLTSVRQTKTVDVSTSLNTRIAKDNVTVVIAEEGNFANQIEIPISELSGGSLELVSISDPISQQRHYAILSGADGDNEIKYRLTINTGATLPTLNLPYYMAVRNIETDLSAQQTNNLVGGASSFISNVAGGAAAGSLGGPGGMMIGAVAGGASAGLSTATNALQNHISANAALEKASRMTPNVSGAPTGFGAFVNRHIGVNIFLKEPSGSGLLQLQDYYRFFGYNKSRIQTPNVKSGTHFYQGNINGDFPGASATDAAIIRSLFSTGVWIWTNEGGELSY